RSRRPARQPAQPGDRAQDARQAARELHLDLRLRLPGRFPDRAMAGRPGAAATRPALPRGWCGGARVTAFVVFAGSALAVVAVLFVARPFLREPSVDDRLDELDAAARRRLELAEERDRSLAALKELELDHRTGKVSDEDYRALVGSLRRRAV